MSKYLLSQRNDIPRRIHTLNIESDHRVQTYYTSCPHAAVRNAKTCLTPLREYQLRHISMPLTNTNLAWSDFEQFC